MCPNQIRVLISLYKYTLYPTKGVDRYKKLPVANIIYFSSTIYIHTHNQNPMKQPISASKGRPSLDQIQLTSRRLLQIINLCRSK